MNLPGIAFSGHMGEMKTKKEYPILPQFSEFYIESKGERLFYARIRKFLVDPKKKDECSVERTSGGDHIFKP